MSVVICWMPWNNNKPNVTRAILHVDSIWNINTVHASGYPLAGQIPTVSVRKQINILYWINEWTKTSGHLFKSL